MSLSDALGALDEFLDDLAMASRREPRRPISLLIICPDCGKNPPFRNRCPKCGGDSWIPAGSVDGIFEWIKARRWRADAQEIEPPRVATQPGVSGDQA